MSSSFLLKHLTPLYYISIGISTTLLYKEDREKGASPLVSFCGNAIIAPIAPLYVIGRPFLLSGRAESEFSKPKP